MKGLKRLGAMALATALSITLVAPISANAEVVWTKDAEGHRTYTNEDTGQSLAVKDFESSESEIVDFESILWSELKTKTITVNSYNETIAIATTSDAARLQSFKSNKKDLKVKIIQKDEIKDTDTEKKPAYDLKGKDGLYYYKNYKGEIVKAKEEDCPKGADYGIYTIRFYTKKAGTYKVTYETVLKNGSTVKQSFKVIAKNDSAPFSTLTYAGKMISVSTKSDSPKLEDLWTKGYGYNTTTVKKGALKVNMNKDFKLKKLEIGKEVYKEIPGTPGSDIIKYYDEGDYTSSLERYDDRTISWKTVKNGKKVKLYEDDNTDKHMYLKDGTYSDKGTFTITYIRVTYYDKKDKRTGRYTIPIYLAKK